jgi:hypothetical protein
MPQINLEQHLPSGNMADSLAKLLHGSRTRRSGLLSFAANRFFTFRMRISSMAFVDTKKESAVIRTKRHLFTSDFQVHS